MATPQLSVVIPVYNEEASLPTLFERLYPALDALGTTYEVIFINDGSRDRSAVLLREQWQRHPETTRVVLFNANYGQHPAIVAGFDHCRGERIVTMDADLQNPPEEIARLLAAMDAGHDYVGGVRRDREDSWFRRHASRAMNRLRERITRIHMTDQGCMLRAYSREIVAAIAASREVSTFIPALAYTFASNPTEIDVAHAGRAAGKSHYPLYKLIRLNFDLITGFSLVPAATFLDVRHAGVGAGASHLRRGHRVPAVPRALGGRGSGVLGPRHPRVLPRRHDAVRAGPHRRVRRAHLPSGPGAAALHDSRRARTSGGRAARPLSGPGAFRCRAPSSLPITTSACAACACCSRTASRFRSW
jgi:undecaprenyl-phosphate 4-deoxy-4-formamido-L-arabinose transferase